jgi:bifunctional non-homologous end joining protein LigD
MKDATWVRPELVAEIRFTEWTRDGSLRHPTFLGLREDKPARDVVRELEQRPPKPPKPSAKTWSVTHPDRVIDEASGITKGDLARYHEAVAAAEMPYLGDRPLMLLRCPENTKTCFVQKHLGKGFAPKVGHGKVEGEAVTFVREPAELVELVQWNVVEIHGWGSRLPRWDRPDQMVLDLDPDPAVPFARVVETARTLRDDLARLGLTSFVKTTGGKGLHLVTPLRPDHPWKVVSALARAVATAAARRAPKELVATMAKSARTGKIFVDYLRNAQGATAVLPYSPRARPGVTVALPVGWRDLGRLDPADFTVATVPKLLARRRADPWADYAAAADKNALDPRRLEKL